MHAILAAPTQGMVKNAVLFDVFRSISSVADVNTVALRPDEKSLTVRLTLNSDVATLTEIQIEPAIAAVLTQLQSDVGARQRT
jgi:phenylalanyl-tRNA synthetase beta chain